MSSFRELKEQADSGDAEAQYQLAKLYNDEETEISQQKAAYYYERAFQQGHHKALVQCILKNRQTGWLNPAFLEAVQKSAEKGYTISRLFYWMAGDKGIDGRQFDPQKGLEYLKKIADSGNPKAQFSLSQVYKEGRGLPISESRSDHYLFLAAQKDPRAAWALFSSLKNKKGKPAIGLVELLYNHKFEPALYYLAYHRKTPFYFDQIDPVKIVKKEHAIQSQGMLTEEEEIQLGKMLLNYYQDLADKGLSKAQVILGDYYAFGTYFLQSDDLACEWYQKAADQEDQEGLFRLGCCYLGGKGITKSEVKANSYFQRAGEKGHILSLVFLGFHYQRSKHDKSLKKAFEYFKKAADMGEPAAQYIVGRFYEHGEGINQSDEKALAYYERASAQNLFSSVDHISVDHKIGELYYLDRGINQSYEKAAHYFKKAAKNYMSWRSTWNVAVCAFQGNGLEYSPENADQYFQLALERMNGELEWKKVPLGLSGFFPEQQKTFAIDWYIYKWGFDEKRGFRHLVEAPFTFLNLVPFSKILARSVMEDLYEAFYLACKDDPHGLFRMGLIYAKHQSLFPHEDPLYYFRQAAEKGETSAQICMGIYSQNREEKLYYLKKAAEEDSPKAFYELGKLCLAEGMLWEAQEWFQLAADENDPDAYLALAEIFKDDRQKSAANYHHAYLLNSPEGVVEQIKIALEENDYKEVFSIFECNVISCFHDKDAIDQIYHYCKQKKIRFMVDYLETVFYKPKPRLANKVVVMHRSNDKAA